MNCFEFNFHEIERLGERPLVAQFPFFAVKNIVTRLS